jgi:hypothetical protein
MYACIYEAGGGSMPLLGKGVHPKFVQELLERVMNSIRNGLGMRETEIAREPS